MNAMDENEFMTHPSNTTIFRRCLRTKIAAKDHQHFDDGHHNYVITDYES